MSDVEFAVHLFEVLGLDLRPSEVKALRLALLKGAGPEPIKVSARAVAHIGYIRNIAWDMKQRGRLDYEEAHQYFERIHQFITIVATELGLP